MCANLEPLRVSGLFLLELPLLLLPQVLHLLLPPSCQLLLELTLRGLLFGLQGAELCRLE